MDKLSVADVVFVNFPFSDLQNSKLRPAVIIASAQNQDWILCQITSKSYADLTSIELKPTDFKVGSLNITSYIRPGKIFTAHETIIDKKVAVLRNDTHQSLIVSIIELISFKGFQK